MRINISTIFQVLALIAQDVLAFEAEAKPQKQPNSPSGLVETPTNAQKLST